MEDQNVGSYVGSYHDFALESFLWRRFENGIMNS